MAKGNKPYKRTDNRQAITVQCKPDEDGDLIKWYRSIAKGDRQNEVKRLLRVALGFPQPEHSEAVTIGLVREIINEELEDFTLDVRQWVMEQLEGLAVVSENGEKTVPIQAVKDTLDDATVAMRMKNIKKDKWG